jgi:Ca-activated chloride channel family protein
MIISRKISDFGLIGFVCITVTMVIIWTNLAWADSFSSLNKKGNKAYKEGEELLLKKEKNKAAETYEQALKYYRDAEIEKPESPELSYNIANVMYQQEKYQDALEKYYKGLSTDEPKDQAATYYNMGNTLYRSGKYPEAIQAYQKCLDLTPDDEEAKYNIEFVRKKMKEMLDKEAQRQQNQKQKSEKYTVKPGDCLASIARQHGIGDWRRIYDHPENKEFRDKRPDPNRIYPGDVVWIPGAEEQSQSSQPAGEQKKKEQKQGQQQIEQQEQQSQSQEEQKKQEKMQPKEGMTKQDAERILNALKDEERDLQKKQKRVAKTTGRRGGKDW